MSTELEVPQTMHMDAEPHEQAPQQEGERQLTERERMMANIARRAQEHREQEEALGAEYDREAHLRGEALPPATFETEPAPVVEAAQEHEASAEEPTEPPPVVASATQPAPAHPQLRQIVIDGQQIAVTDEQFAQLAQMGALAAKSMYQQPAPAYQAPEPVEAPKPSVAVDEARVREAVQRIQFGSPDEGTQALSTLIQDVVRQVPQAPQIDQQRLVAEAEQRAVQRIAAEQTHALVRQEYPEIFKDQGLMALAQQRVHQLSQHALATGRRVNDLDIYREAGNQVYDLLKLPRPGSEITQATAPQAAPAIQPTRSAQIEERKRAAPRNPQPVDRRSAVPEAPRPPTGSEIVNAMRVQRGQQSLQ